MNAEWFALAAVALGASAQSITGIGFALICAPLLTLAFGGSDGVRLANFLGIAINGLMLASGGWRSVDLRAFVALVAPALLIAPVAGSAIQGGDPRILSIVTAALVLMAVGALSAGLRSVRFRGIVGGLVAGAVSGAMNVVAGVAGPAVAIYAANADWSPANQRGTLALYFLCVNVAAVLVRRVPTVSSSFLAGSLVVLCTGFLVGVLASRHISHGLVWSATLALATVGAVAAIVVAAR